VPDQDKGPASPYQVQCALDRTEAGNFLRLGDVLWLYSGGFLQDRFNCHGGLSLYGVILIYK